MAPLVDFKNQYMISSFPQASIARTGTTGESTRAAAGTSFTPQQIDDFKAAIVRNVNKNEGVENPFGVDNVVTSNPVRPVEPQDSVTKLSTREALGFINQKPVESAVAYNQAFAALNYPSSVSNYEEKNVLSYIS